MKDSARVAANNFVYLDIDTSVTIGNDLTYFSLVANIQYPADLYGNKHQTLLRADNPQLIINNRHKFHLDGNPLMIAEDGRLIQDKNEWL
jgi:hypothetical protein